MSLPRSPIFAAAFVLFLVDASTAVAQQQPPSLGETIDVSIINVDVFVTDRQGRRVRGLTDADFEIRENGTLRSITNFAEYEAKPNGPEGTFAVESAQPVAAPRASAEAPAKRTIVIFVEVQAQPSKRVHEIFASLREFVQKAVRPGDSATVVAFDARLGTRQAFTDDTEALSRALTKLEEESIGVALHPRDRMRRASESDAEAAALLAGVGHTTGTPASLSAIERQSAELFDMVDLRRKQAALTSLIEGMSGVDGRKIMVLALQRFGLSPGFDAVAEGAKPKFDLDLRVEKVRQSIMRSANANGVTLYPLYAPGLLWASAPDPQEKRIDVMFLDENRDLYRPGADNAVVLNHTASLKGLADETGGLMAAGPSDIVDLLPHVIDDLDSYYSLAYRATPSGRDARRDVEVTTKNGAYRVRSRRAVIDKSDDTQMADRVIANLYQPFERSLIPIQVEMRASKKISRNRWAVPVVVRVPLGSLTTQTSDTLATGAFSVFVATGGEFGVISDVTRRQQPYSYPLADSENARQSHFTYNVTIEFDHLPDALSIGVRDDVSNEYGLARVALPGRGVEEKRGGNIE
jgi:VWFA-related protein